MLSITQARAGWWREGDEYVVQNFVGSFVGQLHRHDLRGFLAWCENAKGFIITPEWKGEGKKVKRREKGRGYNPEDFSRLAHYLIHGKETREVAKKKKKGKMSDFEKRLAKGQEAYEKSKAGLPTVPPGTYHMKLQEAEVVESKSSKKLQVVRVYQVMEGEHEGETVRDYLQLETEKAGFFTARWIENMGYEAPEKMSGIPEVVAAIAADMPDFMAKVTLSAGGFTNVNFVELLEGGEVVTDDVEEEDEDEDEDEGDEDESEDEDEEEEEDASDEDEDEKEDEEDEDEDEEEEEEEDDEDEDEKQKSDLLTFCQAQDLEVDEDADVETIKAAINQYAWAKDDLTNDEAKLIKTIGGKFAEPKKEKKKAAAKKKGKAKKAKGKKKSKKKGKRK